MSNENQGALRPTTLLDAVTFASSMPPALAEPSRLRRPGSVGDLGSLPVLVGLVLIWDRLHQSEPGVSLR